MHFLDKFIPPPSASQIDLSSYIILLSLLIHLPFMSLFLGCSFYSVFFNLIGSRYQNSVYVRFSKCIINSFMFNKYVGMLFGVLPILILYFSISQYLYQSNLNFSYFFTLLLSVLILGLVLIYGYQYSSRLRPEHLLVNISTGLLGVLLIFLSSFILIGTISLIINFEKRFFVQSLLQLSLSWNAFYRYLLFLSLSSAITGSWTLFYFSDLFDVGISLDGGLRSFIKDFGAFNCYLSIFSVPFFSVLNLFTLPDVAWSMTTILLILLLLVTLFIAYIILIRIQTKYLTNSIVALFIIFFTSYSIVTTNDLVSFKNSTKEHTMYLSEIALKAKVQIAKVDETAHAASEEDFQKQGEMIFKNRCTACHRFTKKLIGPPFLKVLPKYRDRTDKLIAFIMNPVKRDPDYPRMPKLDLKKNEVEAVVNYVLNRLNREEKM